MEYEPKKKDSETGAKEVEKILKPYKKHLGNVRFE